jgi:hypothetical protein
MPEWSVVPSAVMLSLSYPLKGVNEYESNS